MTVWVDFTRASEHDGHYPLDPTLDDVRKHRALQMAEERDPDSVGQKIAMAESLLSAYEIGNWRPEGWDT